MKSYTKKELALRADVSPRTFARWLAQHREKLAELGVSVKDKIIPPKAVKYIADAYGIDVD